MFTRDEGTHPVEQMEMEEGYPRPDRALVAPASNGTVALTSNHRTPAAERRLMGIAWGGGFAPTLLTQVSILGLGAYTGIVVARLLGPQGRGELAALTIWPQTLVLLLSLGINQAIVFQTGRRNGEPAEIWTAGTLIGAGQAMLVILAGLLIIPRALSAYPAHVRQLSLVFLAVTPLLILSGYPGNLFQGQLKMVPFNVIRAAPAATYAVGLLFLWALRKFNLTAVVALQMLGIAGAFALGHFLLWRMVGLGFTWNPRIFSGLLGYGAKTHLATLSSYVNQRADQLLLTLFVPAQDLGYYVVAVTVAEAVGFFPQAVGLVTLASGSNLSETEARQLIAGSFRSTLIWLTVLCGSLLILAPFMIMFFFGSAFARSALACRILLIGSLAWGLKQVLYEGARAMGQPTLPSYAEGLAAVLTVIGLFLLLPRLGFVGAALASTVAYSGSLLLMLILARTRMRVGVRHLLGLDREVGEG